MYDTIIIGAGIAGLTAALYASRNRMSFEIIASEFGGQCMESGEVLNYPGIVKTNGVKFAGIMEKQMAFNKVNVLKETVQTIKKNGDTFVVVTNKKEYPATTIILATGARARKLNIPGEDKLANKGVMYCAICDGPLFAKQEVAVIGGGDSALSAVDFLKNIAKKIYLVTIDPKLTGQPYLVERVMNNPKVEVIYNAKTKEVLGDKFVTGLSYEVQGQAKTLKLKGIFIEIGRVPSTDFIKDIIPVDEHKHIVIDAQCKTQVPGVFAAGDCASGHEYQYVIAAGQGCMALIKAVRYVAQTKQKG